MIDVDILSLPAAALTVFITLIFTRAVAHKLGAFTEFTGFVADYRLVPERFVTAVSFAVVGGEAISVGLSLLPGGRSFGLGIAALMLAVYAGAMALNIRRGRPFIECGCGGAVQPLSWSLVVRNGLLVTLALIANLLPLGPLAMPDAIAAIAAGFALWVVFLLVEQILSNATFARLTR